MTTTDSPSGPPDHSVAHAGGSAVAAGGTLSMDILRGDPTPEELAALSAVVQDAYVREAAAAVVGEPVGMSAWAVSQRGLRQPLRRELGWVGSIG